jgi:HK97 family phage portal protein
MGMFDFLRASSSPRGRIEPALVGNGASHSASNVQSESQWKGFQLPVGPSRAGVRVDERSVLTLPAALQALRILCGVFAMTPLAYYRRIDGGRERATDDPLWKLLHDRPNAHQSAFAFREILLADVLLTGNFYAYVSRDSAFRPVALTRLKPGHVVVAEYFDRSTGLELFYDATLPDGTRERFPARDVWHVAGMSRDGEIGLNPIAYMRDAFGGAVATQDYTARFWANNAKPPLMLKTDAKIQPEDKERIREMWRQKYAGVDGDFIAVVDQGLTPEFLSQDHDKSQMIETRTFQVLDIARAWGVPPHLIFELSRATFSNIEHQSLEFVTFHMGPHYERVASAAGRQFAAEDHYFEFLTDALVKGDIKTRWEAYKIQRETGVLNADEIRARENLNAIGGAAGTERWRPSNYTIAGTPPPAPAQAPAPGPSSAPAEPSAP